MQHRYRFLAKWKRRATERLQGPIPLVFGPFDGARGTAHRGKASGCYYEPIWPWTAVSYGGETGLHESHGDFTLSSGQRRPGGSKVRLTERRVSRAHLHEERDFV